jgi:hypothetical protein
MAYIFMGFALFVNVASAELKVSRAGEPFTFDEATERCVNKEKIEGLNAFVPSKVFLGINSTDRNRRWPKRNVQCIDFRKVRFHDFLGSNYATLVGWDFRGSKFEGAQLSFNFIELGLFKGSSIDFLTIGYGRVTAADLAFNKGDMPLP